MILMTSTPLDATEPPAAPDAAPAHDPDSLASRMRVGLHTLGWSQRHVAWLVGITEGRARKMARGKVRMNPALLAWIEAHAAAVEADPEGYDAFFEAHRLPEGWRAQAGRDEDEDADAA